jgi:hypothetical protein
MEFGEFTRRENLVDVGIPGRIILKFITKSQGVMMWAGLIWLGTGEMKAPVNTVIKFWVSLQAGNLLNS